MAALARPEPIDEATSATVSDWSYDLTVPSGSVTLGITHEKKQKIQFYLDRLLTITKIKSLNHFYIATLKYIKPVWKSLVNLQNF